MSIFEKRTSIEQVEEDVVLAPKFNEEGLITVVTTESATGDVLMVGYMNQEAFQKTLETGEAHYYSRSRKILWHKGATSGLVQKIIDFKIDDDQDAVWIKVQVTGNGASCHVGYKSCFYRSVALNKDGTPKLTFTESEKTFDPKEVYGDVPNPTIL